MARTRYRLADNTPVPSVTELLGTWHPEGIDGLMFWAAGLGSRFRSQRYRGADIGTQVHDWIDAYLQRRSPTWHERCDTLDKRKEARERYDRWAVWARTNLKAYTDITTEQPLTSEHNAYGGTPDFVATHKRTGEIWLLDWKAGRYRQDYLIQAAAYQQLLDEAGRRPHRCALVIIPKESHKPAYQHDFTAEDLKSAWKIFQRLLQLNTAYQEAQQCKKTS